MSEDYARLSSPVALLLIDGTVIASDEANKDWDLYLGPVPHAVSVIGKAHSVLVQGNYVHVPPERVVAIYFSEP